MGLVGGLRLSTIDIYPLVNVYITMEHHHAINGKVNYVYGSFSIANCNSHYQYSTPQPDGTVGRDFFFLLSNYGTILGFHYHDYHHISVII